ncbi:MAG: MFS transporter [Bacteroidetes bacterium]|nr:MFS transporter [Bacteroidota bacterium]
MKKYIALIINLSLIHFLLGLDINIVSVTLPSIAAQFGVAANVASRVVWVYLLVLTCFLLAFGRLGDIKGFKKIYFFGILVFIAGSVLCFFANNFNLLVAFRIIQALGSSVLFALTPAIIAAGIPEEYRGRVYGINYSFTAFGGIIGRAASGYIIDAFGWNFVFILSAPVGLAALYITYKYLSGFVPSGSNRKFDMTGTLLIFAGLFFFLFAVNNGEEFGWLSLNIIGMFAASVVLITLFIFRQLKIDFPLFNVRILSDKDISFSILSFVFVYIITNGMIYITPFFLQWIGKYPKKETGLLMAVPSLLQFVSGYLSGILSDRKNSKIICTYGIIMIALSLLAYTIINPLTNVYLIILILSFYGFAIGFFIPSNTNKIMTSAPSGQKGVVSSFMTTSIRLGSAFGVVFFGAVFAFLVPQKNPLQAGIPVEIILEGFRYTFIFGFIVSVLGLLSVLLTGKRNSK